MGLIYSTHVPFAKPTTDFDQKGEEPNKNVGWFTVYDGL